MNKRKIILGLLICMITAICGAFVTMQQPEVFAAETTEQTESFINEAGIFYGQGYYTLGDTATLKAEMNPGYDFDAWVSIDADNNETILSTEKEYTFVVERNITIEPRWTEIVYQVNLADNLWNTQKTDLKDFTHTIVDKTAESNNNETAYTYDNAIEITMTIKNDVYIYDLFDQNITINGVTIYNIIRTGNEMNVACDIVNNNTGFTSLKITLNIREDIVIDVNYIYMYTLQMASGNSIDISELMQFVKITNNYGILSSSNYTYLVRADKEVEITVEEGNDIYALDAYQFEGRDPSREYSQAYFLRNNTTFTLTYNKSDYFVKFVPYLINLHGEQTKMTTTIYDITDVSLTAGDGVSFVYDDASKQITITDIKDSIVVTYDYPVDIFGYNFKGFAINGEIITDTTFTLSDVAPSNAEIQLIFEYIKYSLEVKLIDNYFIDGVTLDAKADDTTLNIEQLNDNLGTYKFKLDNSYDVLVSCTDITLQANTNKYTIVGWSNSSTPKVDGYLQQADDSSSDKFTFTFEPTGDDNAQAYIIYLDIDYKYSSVEYNLKPNSIIQNVDYNIVAVDKTNKKLIFSDSENIIVSREVTYTDNDITTSEGKTIIATSEFGDIEIDNDVLSYTVDLNKVSSINKETSNGVDIYTFDKYTYFGELHLGLVEYIILNESGENVTLELGGTIYSSVGKVENTTIQSVVTTKSYNSITGTYTINYNYTTTLYMNGTEYDYITIRDVKYYYNGEKFVLNNATINIPKEVKYSITKGASYSIRLSNLLPNALLMYSTQTNNATNYEFTSFTNYLGSGLTSFKYDNIRFCLLNVTSTPSLSVEYRRLANDIILIINNEGAYSYDDIVFTVQGEDGISSNTGRTISAKHGEVITITINADSIVKGYQFDEYVIANTTDADSDKYVLKFTMDSQVHANQVININFSTIQYTININYIDGEGNIISQTDANGVIRLQNGDDLLTSLVVDLTGEYTFEAEAIVGYYVGNAYMGTDADTLTGLISNNDSEQLITTWQLNNTNFADVVIDNAGDGTEVNLYIYFEIHKYSIKVYFEVDSNAGIITYPSLRISYGNDIIEPTLTVAEETENGISTIKRYVLVENFEYSVDTTATLTIYNFMTGTTIQKWTNAKGEQLSISTQYVLTGINQDVVLKAVLQFVDYSFDFVILDENGETCNYGSASTTSKTFRLLDKVNYTINTNIGYVLKNKYYYNSVNEIGTQSIDTGFEFYPSRFRIEDGTTIKIYLVFGLKVVNLSINNVIDGSLYYFKEYQASDLATYTISRTRGTTIEELNADTGYQFQTGDILTMDIKPISIGIELSKVQLGSTNVTLSSTNPYLLTTVDVKEDDKLTGMYYALRIEFTAGVINALEENDVLNNIIKVKTFKIAYTYNYIDYQFGIRLIRQYGGSTLTGSEDEALIDENVGFGSEMLFSCTYEGLNSGDGGKFKINGFTVAGIKQSEERFRFNSIDLWEQVALDKYSQNSSDIAVVLVLQPKITLSNYTRFNDENGYIYERSYNGQKQGLTNSGASMDVVVGGDFETIIQYSYDNGLSYLDTKPIDAGEYSVKIIAKISSESAQITDVVFDEKVTYIIMPATLTISLKTYSAKNPVTKPYDGNNTLGSKAIIDDMEFGGIYSRDKNNIFVDASKLRVQFSGVLVNSALELYDIDVFDVYLIDSANNLITNYKLDSGQNTTFKRIGKINPKELKITGFVPNNKVYDGTNEVIANLEGITYIGKLSTDSTKILTENLKFYVEDYSIGERREVFIDYSNALVGADSTNYTITYDKTYINIHPYELTYYLKDCGTFKIVDKDNLCVIPIGANMFARTHDRGSSEYRSIYSLVETHVSQGEKLKEIYEVIIQVGSVNQLVPEGAYVYLPKAKKVTKVVQVPDEQDSQNLDILPQEKFVVVRVGEGEALFGVVVRTTYLPLWAIILIVIASALVILVIVMTFIIIRRKTKGKYKSYDRI